MEFQEPRFTRSARARLWLVERFSRLLGVRILADHGYHAAAWWAHRDAEKRAGLVAGVDSALSGAASQIGL